MKKIIMPVAILLFAINCNSQNNKENPTSIKIKNKTKMNAAAEKEAIEKLLSSYGENLNDSNVSKIVALFTQDGIIMPQGSPVSIGRERLKSTYEGLFKAFQLNVKYFTDEVIVSGDYAYARTNSKGTTLIRASEATIPVDNKELFVLRYENGQWKIFHYMFNNNLR